MNKLFETNKSFNIATTSFYNIYNNNTYNWGEIPKNCSEYIKDILQPTNELEDRIKYVFNSIYDIKDFEKFKVIHIRTSGNVPYVNNCYSDSLYNEYYTKISNIINNNTDIKFVLTSDSSMLANKLNDNIKELYYWDNKKVHIGELYDNVDSALLDTLTDFFILSKSCEIISNGWSGFSKSVSLIYNIKYTNF